MKQFRNTDSILFAALIFFMASGKQSNDKQAQSNKTTIVKKPELDNTAPGQADITVNDNMINNAGMAKKPRGKMSYVLNGQPITIDENQVQCMYVGMNSSMAQSVISGGNQVSIVHMGIPNPGKVDIKMIGPLPDVGIQVIIDGEPYNNKKASDAELFLTKVTPDGKNYYVAGSFSGRLSNRNGSKTVTVTDGKFESAYLQ